MNYRMGIDIGGTFTDFAMIDDASGAATLEKLLTTPQDPSIAVLEGVRKLLEAGRIPSAAVRTIVHGSTLVTNAVIERKGTPTGMLVTKGFRDVLDIALERRYDLYDLRLRFPDPLVPRPAAPRSTSACARTGSRSRRRISPRTRRRCAALSSSTRSGDRGVLPAFVHQPSPRARGGGLRSQPNSPSCTCLDLRRHLPFMREYERWTTTAINAFMQPIVDTYLRARKGGSPRGFRGRSTS